MNSLLDDLRADDYAEALSSGNLKGKKPNPAAVPFERYTTTGYRVNFVDYICDCGAKTKVFASIMHRETGEFGALRERALHLTGTEDLASFLPRLPSAECTARVHYCSACLPMKDPHHV